MRSPDLASYINPLTSPVWAKAIEEHTARTAKNRIFKPTKIEMTGTSICHKFQKPEQISEMGVKIQEIPYEKHT